MKNNSNVALITDINALIDSKRELLLPLQEEAVTGKMRQQIETVLNQRVTTRREALQYDLYNFMLAGSNKPKAISDLSHLIAAAAVWRADLLGRPFTPEALFDLAPTTQPDLSGYELNVAIVNRVKELENDRKDNAAILEERGRLLKVAEDKVVELTAELATATIANEKFGEHVQNLESKIASLVVNQPVAPIAPVVSDDEALKMMAEMEGQIAALKEEKTALGAQLLTVKAQANELAYKLSENKPTASVVASSASLSDCAGHVETALASFKASVKEDLNQVEEIMEGIRELLPKADEVLTKGRLTMINASLETGITRIENLKP